MDGTGKVDSGLTSTRFFWHVKRTAGTCPKSTFSSYSVKNLDRCTTANFNDGCNRRSSLQSL